MFLQDAKFVDCMCVWLCSVHKNDLLHPVLENISGKYNMVDSFSEITQFHCAILLWIEVGLTSTVLMFMRYWSEQMYEILQFC